MFAGLIIEAINRTVDRVDGNGATIERVRFNVALILRQFGRVAHWQIVAKRNAKDVFTPKHLALRVRLLAAEKPGAEGAGDEFVYDSLVDDICRHRFLPSVFDDTWRGRQTP